MEEQTLGDSRPIVIQQSSRQGLWILLAVVTGFSLPMLACIIGIVVIIFAGGLGSALNGPASTSSGGSGPAIAIVRIEGVIVGTDDTNYLTGAGSGTVIADLKAAEADEDVKAIILRVDSPGGTVTGSAQIHEVIRDEISKPIVVSMASVAASGGYYVSASADYIFARADTTTGSLGVIMSLFNVSGLLEEWGVDVLNVTSGPNKAIGSPYDAVSPAHIEILETLISESYDEFVKVIVDGRGLEDAVVRELADGRIYSGRQAVKNGLIDEIGNFSDAIAHAATLGGIVDEPRLIEFERTPDYSNLLSMFSQLQNRTAADEVRVAIEEYSLPKLEYRYMGQ
ncbi:MAG: protease-4 [Cellvibrionaceae bacterium]|jgi:protease-4